MRRTTSQGIRQLLSTASLTYPPETSRAAQVLCQCLRSFSTSPLKPARKPSGPPLPIQTIDKDADITELFSKNQKKRSIVGVPALSNQQSELEPLIPPGDSALAPYKSQDTSLSNQPIFGGLNARGRLKTPQNPEPHHFHVYATKHNTHITLTTPERNPMLSMACGYVGFRKHNRKHYDSAFQLARWVLKDIRENGMSDKISQLEIVLRGYGQGRDAVIKALLGVEGKYLRDRICKVSDATRLKFGGTKGPNPRRL